MTDIQPVVAGRQSVSILSHNIIGTALQYSCRPSGESKVKTGLKSDGVVPYMVVNVTKRFGNRIGLSCYTIKKSEFSGRPLILKG